MGSLRKIGIALICLSLASARARATVDLTLYNSFALLDSDNSTYLAGNTGSGDLVQLILVGPNGVIDAPSVSGGVGGDDSLFFTTHVGAGYPTPTDGFLVQSSILYADLFAGSNAFVRFWNASAPASATYYGTSMVFALPARDAFGLAEYDFVPLSGSPRTANIPWEAGPAAIPEPSSLFLLGLVIIGGWMYKKHRSKLKLAVTACVLLWSADSLNAQLASPLDVMASVPIHNADGSVLPGSNPVTGDSTQCVVQVLSVGGNGIPDLPNLDGTAGGDDAVIFTTVIGQGMLPEITTSGQFSTSFYPPPPAGTKIYSRAFNGSTLAAATHWMQSATFTVNNTDVFDVSPRGLQATTQPKSTNPTATDTDKDGQSDYTELVANTNPLKDNDRLDVNGIIEAPASGGRLDIGIAGRAGRAYTLQRSTDELTLGTGMTWQDVDTRAMLSVDTSLVLSDSSSPATSKAFYRVRVRMP